MSVGTGSVLHAARLGSRPVPFAHAHGLITLPDANTSTQLLSEDFVLKFMHPRETDRGRSEAEGDADLPLSREPDLAQGSIPGPWDLDPYSSFFKPRLKADAVKLNVSYTLMCPVSHCEGDGAHLPSLKRVRLVKQNRESVPIKH